MSDVPPSIPLVLQLGDTVSARECSLLLESSDAGPTLGALLERYLRNAPIDRLLEESRITRSSADALFAIQDLVYASDGTSARACGGG